MEGETRTTGKELKKKVEEMKEPKKVEETKEMKKAEEGKKMKNELFSIILYK